MKRKSHFGEIHRVALYLRVSTAEQVHGHSMDSQLNELSRWAKSEGWEISDTYEDPGASGTSVEGRPDFQRMVADAKVGKFDAILVLKVDRFARSVMDAAFYRRLLAECGVRLLSRTEPSLGDDSPAGLLMEGMFDLNSEYYSRALSYNVARGKATRAEKGLPLGDIPFGYRSIGPQEAPEIVCSEAEVLREAFRLYATGRYSQLEIAAWLNSQGFRPRSKRGRLVFSKATVRGMLENAIYVGDITRHGKVVGRGRHEPIISRELWDRVQRVKEERAHRSQIYSARPKRPYLFSGLGHCSSCGSPVWANTIASGVHNYYRCASRSRGDECVDSKVGCRADQPEEQVSSLFAGLELPPKWRERVQELVAQQGSVMDVEQERRRLGDKIVRVRKGLIEGVLDNELAKAAVREAQAALAALPKTDEAPLRAGEALTDIRELWPHMTAEERRDLVRLVLAEVSIDLRGAQVNNILPKPAFAPLFVVISEQECGPVRICAGRPRRGTGPQAISRYWSIPRVCPCPSSCQLERQVIDICLASTARARALTNPTRIGGNIWSVSRECEEDVGAS